MADDSTSTSDGVGHAVHSVAASRSPKWSTWGEAVRVVLYPAYLRKTVAIAIVVGTVLFAINQLDIVVRGDATTLVWLKSAVTYFVPFCVSNAGVLVASRRRREPSTRPGPTG
ncbi:MAG TPA: nitrate/nitrite transporter NrtS [Acidimicrobiia bacterium]|nr:nitrate/nitrite transporter NrtS [Acidimicrobiia bacterium]